ncbi:MAG: tRNA (adenosine(37)-N6)-threonylcarbamoyltransferase complex transferase subunit TsaD [Planctomycetota bacterium]|nr:tRNA (adenosine(37)-N6)-threonylcarbamoyltransferase complex transferase subunit TsaD [Planctomycetota bacterium]
MLILGIESSCDETAAAVVESGALVRSSVVASQTALHEEYAGVVPEIASRAHVEQILPVIREALAQAGVGLGMIDAIAVGNRPGLIGCLLVGVAAAKALSWSLNKPLIAVDHVAAHLYSGLLVEGDAPHHPHASRHSHVFPALGLVVSGGHTSLYHLESWTMSRRLGSTIDDAIGEAFDKAAAILGLSYPGGPNIDRLARSPGANEAFHAFPISRLSPDSLDFSFSGLKTAMLYATKGVPGERGAPAPPLTEDRKRDLAASFQHAAVKAIILKLSRAIAVTPGMRTLLTGGGVTANSHLRLKLAELASHHGLELSLPAMKFCVDNAAMVAGLGYHLHAAGKVASLDLQAVPTTGMA